MIAFGDGEIQAPFGQGHLCVRPAVGQTRTAFGTTISSASGQATIPMDASLLGPTITSLSTWKFQCLYRDAAVASWNGSRAVSLMFCP